MAHAMLAAARRPGGIAEIIAIGPREDRPLETATMTP